MSRNKGFTLFELIITIALLCILITLAVPPLSQWIQRSKVRNLQYQLLHGIHFSRTQASQLQSTVTLCPGTAECEKSWGHSLLIFSDLNSNGQQDDDDRLLKQVHLSQFEGTLNWRSFRGKPYLQFNAGGLTHALNGTFHYCPVTVVEDDAGGYKFSLIVARTGRARISDTPTCP